MIFCTVGVFATWLKDMEMDTRVAHLFVPEKPVCCYWCAVDVHKIEKWNDCLLWLNEVSKFSTCVGYLKASNFTCFLCQSVNPYIVKLSIVDDEPTLDVSKKSISLSYLCINKQAVECRFWPLHLQPVTGLTEILDVFFLSQGMGMVVHQALTEYNRWDLKLCQKRVF